MEDSSSPNHSSSSPMELFQAALQLIYWREPRKSLAAFVSSLMVLVAMATLSVISVVSYLLLAFLCVTITFRSLLDRDISVSSESARQLADWCRNRLNWLSVQTRRLLLVEDLVDSLKMAAIMWLMTYVGALFNGVTILILADVVFFTAPPIYQKKKTQIDRQLVLLQSKLEKVLLRLQDRLPGAVRRSKAE
ncbi:reticulon-3-like isoform X3 [Gambusia affinis]|uniref:reticulon-3-like isoform X3 n=1 Tax=Gambusia affinis TaxID=33528 RepID=UPI001CDD6E10|nr:reticulon-3-like isoform X3 [Gambusia affinis]